MSQERKRWESQQKRHRKLDENIREMKRYQREHLNLSNIENIDKNKEMNSQFHHQNFQPKVSNSCNCEAKPGISSTEKVFNQDQRKLLDKYRDQIYRKMICENSEDIRKLKFKLREAYCAKENLALTIGKKAKALEELRLEAHYGSELERDAIQFAAKEQEDEKMRSKQMIEYSSELDKQLREKAHRRMKAYQEFILEKMAIDEIVRRIHEEDQKLAEQSLIKRRVRMAEMEAFRKQQEQFRRANEKRIREENERIIREIAEQESREDTSARDREERLSQLEIVQVKLRAYIEAKEAERSGIENLRQQLSQEEMEYAAMKTDTEEFKKKLQDRLELQKAHQQSIVQRAKRMAIEKEEEEVYHRQLLAQMAKCDRIEQISDEKRRQKKLDHRRELNLMIERRAQELVKLRLEEENAQAQIQRQEELRRRIVEEERNRLLREHAEQLLGFLPRDLSSNALKTPTIKPDM
nr:meiosis specific nuclear structural protein [Hymenolepis microstoma]